ncbi:unnamed protein product [Rhizophagus irregularis]|nr:unnamed protein product [Rhizophagus irregularis]
MDCPFAYLLSSQLFEFQNTNNPFPIARHIFETTCRMDIDFNGNRQQPTDNSKCILENQTTGNYKDLTQEHEKCMMWRCITSWQTGLNALTVLKSLVSVKSGICWADGNYHHSYCDLILKHADQSPFIIPDIQINGSLSFKN